MLQNDSSKFYLPKNRIEEHRASVARKNFVLIALAATMSIYGTGIALALLV